MAIPGDLGAREKLSIIESTSVAGLPAQVVVNPDGSNIGTAGSVLAAQGAGAAATSPWSVELSDGSAFYTATKTGQLPTALVAARLDVNIGAIAASLAAGTNVIGHVILDASTAVIGHVIVDSGAVAVSATVPDAQGNSFTILSASSGTVGSAPLGVFPMGFNGTTWDRLRVDTNKALSTNLADVGGAAIALGTNTMANAIPVTIASNQPTLNVAGIDSATNGNIVALNGAVTVNPNLNGNTAFEVSGTWTGTLTFEASTDNIGYVAVNAYPVPSGAAVTTTTANGFWVIPSAGFYAIRVRASAAMTGTATVYGRPSGTQLTINTSPTAANLNAAVVGIGTAGTAAGGILTVQGVASMTPLLSTATLAAGSALAAAVNAYGQTDKIYNATVALTPKFAFANITASATNSAIVAAVTSKKIRVLAASAITGATATTWTFTSGSSGAISSLKSNGVNGGFVYPYNPLGWFETVSGEALNATTGAGSTTGVDVVYVEV